MEKKIFNGHYLNVIPAMVQIFDKRSNFSESIANIKFAGGHVNVLRYYGSETHHKEVHMAFETCESSLEGIKWDSIDDRGLLKIIRGMIEGVGYLHDKGIVHGNLCPSNVLLDRHGNPKLTGLGQSKLTINENEIDKDLFDLGNF
nr:putative receptor-like protein kinase At4g00960 isoform X1 [Tanacetum cinerariifolium]